MRRVYVVGYRDQNGKWILTDYMRTRLASARYVATCLHRRSDEPPGRIYRIVCFVRQHALPVSTRRRSS
jgi:hypothetical protein